MEHVFADAHNFNGDLSKWDVSRVTDMPGMFREAKSFNRDISEWDVSSVTEMDDMFLKAISFEQQFCTPDWSRSKASKKDMFEGSSGSISNTACTSAPVTNQAPHQYLSRLSITDRELIVRTSTSTPVSAASITSNFDR